MSGFLERFSADFARHRLMVVLRGASPESVLRTADVLCESGVRFIEVTMNSPDPLASIGGLVARFSGTDMHVGAGTVLRPEEARSVAEAGGSYIVSPNFSPEVVRETRRLGLVSVPGFLTPTEGFAAVAAGADYLKCFPASVVGPGYLKALKAVLAAPVIAVGGVSLGNLAGFLDAAAGVAVGASLCSPDRTPEEIRRDASALVRACARKG